MAVTLNAKILLKRGYGDPSTSLSLGEAGYDISANKLYIGNGIGNIPMGVVMDPSANNLYNRVAYVDGSIVDLRNINSIQDTSISTLKTRVDNHDVSINWLDLYRQVMDVSLAAKVWRAGDTMTGRLVVDASLKVTGLSYLDTDVSIGGNLFVHGTTGAIIDSSLQTKGDVSIGGSLTITNCSSIGNNLPYAQIDVSNGNKIVRAGNYYGQEFFYTQDLSPSSTTTPNDQTSVRHTLTTGYLRGGVYKLTNFWIWGASATNNQSYTSLYNGSTRIGTNTVNRINNTAERRADMRSYYLTLEPSIYTFYMYYYTSRSMTQTIYESNLELIRVS